MKLWEKSVWVVLSCWLIGAALPASLWYNPGQMDVDDFVRGEPIDLLYDGGAVRVFSGSYSVVLRDIETQEIVAETGSARFQYDPDSVRPSPLLLAWWAPADDRFIAPPPGKYRLDTCWTVHDALWGLVPAKKTCIESNIFRILERESE